jgi:hypothetical protein
MRSTNLPARLLVFVHMGVLPLKFVNVKDMCGEKLKRCSFDR